MQKTLGIYQSYICQIGGVETFLYNFCYNMRHYYNITVVYGDGDELQLKRLSEIVKVVKYSIQPKFEFDIVLRNSVWGEIPQKIFSKDNRYIEMRHADYNHLLEQGKLYNQYLPWDKTNSVVACGDYVNKMSRKTLKDKPTTIKNILLPNQPVHKILHLISCTRLDKEKGWKRMLQLANMLKEANIKFEWHIFTNSPKSCPYPEIIFRKQSFDIFDNIAEADYCVLLSDCEGLPYTVQEALQYKTPCIVTDVGGCTELIKDGINGYVVPLDMNFDVKKLLKIPQCEEYDNHATESWIDYLGNAEYIENPKTLTGYKVKATKEYEERNIKDVELGRIPKQGETWECDVFRASKLNGNNSKGIKFVDLIEEIWE